MFFQEDKDFLEHVGVKGMHWGKRKVYGPRTTANYDRGSMAELKPGVKTQKERNMQIVRMALKTNAKVNDIKNNKKVVNGRKAMKVIKMANNLSMLF